MLFSRSPLQYLPEFPKRVFLFVLGIHFIDSEKDFRFAQNRSSQSNPRFVLVVEAVMFFKWYIDGVFQLRIPPKNTPPLNVQNIF